MLLRTLKALAEPTRLCIVDVLARGEFNVSELGHVLGQSQPRVSRHLKLLCEAGVLSRHQEGASALFSLSKDGTGSEVVRHVLPHVDRQDPEWLRVNERLEALREVRAREAGNYFRKMADQWDRFRNLTVGEAVVEQCLLNLTAGSDIRDFLDLGTGTGRILELFAPHIRRGLGIDLSAEMLRVARAKLDQPELSHCEFRKGDLYALNVPAGSYDATVLHHVLHYLSDPELAVREAARTLRPGGQLLVVDFAPHQHEVLRTEQAHRRLGLRDDEVALWFERAGLGKLRVEHLTGDNALDNDRLAVTIWCATQNADAPSHYRLDAA
jgi:ubiquinone/menaquinone biosynthesis C-methylase UbiE/DNA-binding transcriptional ArsR family regulator